VNKKLLALGSTAKVSGNAVGIELTDADQLEAAADQAITACGGDEREAAKALIVANHFLQADLEKLKAAVPTGYARGKLFEAAKTLPRDRKDRYD
jgi:hypothetical protein